MCLFCLYVYSPPQIQTRFRISSGQKFAGLKCYDKIMILKTDLQTAVPQRICEFIIHINVVVFFDMVNHVILLDTEEFSVISGPVHV